MIQLRALCIIQGSVYSSCDSPTPYTPVNYIHNFPGTEINKFFVLRNSGPIQIQTVHESSRAAAGFSWSIHHEYDI